VERDELVRLFEQAGGFIHVGEEDFGISMVEALAAGTPVVALDRGGAQDIVREGLDGRLVSEPEVGPLRDAVRAVAERVWDPHELAARAATFDRKSFVQHMLAQVDQG
jgi:glycosyltransferase involved in cell wall biosynthesis